MHDHDGEQIVNLKINPDATESQALLQNQSQQEGVMLKDESIQQMNSVSKAELDEGIRLSLNNEMALRASPPASMVEIPGKLNDEQQSQQ